MRDMAGQILQTSKSEFFVLNAYQLVMTPSIKSMKFSYAHHFMSYDSCEANETADDGLLLTKG